MRPARALLATAALALPALLPLTSYGVAGASTSTGEIRGHVTMRSTGKPIANVCVSIPGGLSDLTNSKGYYQITGLSPGDYSVDFGIEDSCSYSSTPPHLDLAPTMWSAAGGYGSDVDTVTVRSGETVRGISQKMRRGGHIAGRIVDAGGLPVAGAGVGAYLATDKPHDACCHSYAGGATTDSDGRFTVKALPTGSFDVVMSKSPGYLVKTWWPSVGFQDDATPIAVTAAHSVRGIDQTLRHQGVSGTLDDGSGSPLPGSYVSLWRYKPDLPFRYWPAYTTRAIARTGTHNDGTWSFFDVPAGTYRVLFTPSASFAPPTFYPDASDPNDAQLVTVPYGHDVTGIAGSEPHDARISGTVTDAAGAALQYVCVTAVDVDHPYSAGIVGGSETAADGTYTVHGLAAGSYVLEFRDCTGTTSYGTIFHGGARTVASATPVAVQPAEFVNAGVDVLPAGGAISGSDGLPTDNGTLVLATSPTGVTTTTTTRDGTYTLAALTAGEWTVRFDACSSFAGLTEWWDNAHSASDATPVAVAAGTTTSGIDASFEQPTAAQPCSAGAAMRGLTATPNSTHSALLTWSRPGGNRLPWSLEVSVVGGPVADSFDLSWKASRATVGGLLPGHSYTFAVTARYAPSRFVTATSNTVVMP